MSDEERDPLKDGMQVAIARAFERLDRKVDDKELRGTVEMLHAADERIFQNALAVIERSNTSHKEYVRDRVNESGLKTENALKDMEKHLKEHTSVVVTAAVAAALAPLMEHRNGNRSGWHPVPVSVGTTALVSALWVIAQIMGLRIPGAG